MSKGKQTTLLQTWGYEGNSQFSQKTKPSIEDAFKNDDFDDALLANAEERIEVCDFFSFASLRLLE